MPYFSEISNAGTQVISFSIPYSLNISARSSVVMYNYGGLWLKLGLLCGNVMVPILFFIVILTLSEEFIFCLKLTDYGHNN